MNSRRSLLGLMAAALISAAAYAVDTATSAATRTLDYGARALRVAYDFVVTPFLSLYTPTPDFDQTQRHALTGSISKVQARSFTQRLMQRDAWAGPASTSMAM